MPCLYDFVKQAKRKNKGFHGFGSYVSNTKAQHVAWNRVGF